MTEPKPGPKVFEVHRRTKDDELFDVLTEIPEPSDRFMSVAIRSQRTGRTHWVTTGGLMRKYDRIS
ncbi:hypothetical protein [Leucobacter luti]|nr:hypothetical protein [Leucobacter luti]